MAFLLYLGALLRHWIALMSGVVSLIIGSGVVFGWWNASTVGQPKWWWTISGLAFFWATFRAWNHERSHRLQTEAERAGPQLLLEFDPQAALDVAARPGWRVRNTGDADALEARVDSWRQGEMYAEVAPIQGVARGQGATLSFRIFTDRMAATGGAGLLSHHPEQMLEYALRGDRTWAGGADEVLKRGNPRIPVRMRY